MTLTLDDVNRIAHLARIEVEPGEAEQVLVQLAGIFRMIEEMQAVDTEGVEPMSHAQDVTLRMRDDKVSGTDQHVLFQSGAPQVDSGLYLVPKVIE
jgi:aspartyl-tRNA(Asn)/glutamyl-tRNA(Gln) amidotransferase subunit C